MLFIMFITSYKKLNQISDIKCSQILGVLILPGVGVNTTVDNSSEKVLDIKPNTWLQTNKKCKVALKIFLVSKYRPYIHISNSILFCIFIVSIPISWSNSLRMGIEKKTVFILMPGWDLGFTWDLWRWLGWRRQSSRVVSKECRGGSHMVDFVQL